MNTPPSRFLGGSERLADPASRLSSFRPGERGGRQTHGQAKASSRMEASPSRQSSRNCRNQGSFRLPLRRTVSSPKLDLIPEASSRGKGKEASRSRQPPVPKLNLLNCSSSSSVAPKQKVARDRREEELSQEFLPSRYESW